MKHSLTLLILVYLSLTIPGAGQTAQQTTGDLVWHGEATTIQAPESSSKIIMSCSGVSGEDLKVAGCELVNGGTLDDVVNQFLQASQEQQYQYDKLREAFTSYLEQMEQIFEQLRKKEAAQRRGKKKVGTLPCLPSGRICPESREGR